MEEICRNCKFFTPQDENTGVCSVRIWVNGDLRVNTWAPATGVCGLFERRERP